MLDHDVARIDDRGEVEAQIPVDQQISIAGKLIELRGREVEIEAARARREQFDVYLGVCHEPEYNTGREIRLTRPAIVIASEAKQSQ